MRIEDLGPIYSTRNVVTFRFTSDDSVTDRSFLLTVSAEPGMSLVIKYLVFPSVLEIAWYQNLQQTCAFNSHLNCVLNICMHI